MDKEQNTYKDNLGNAKELEITDQFLAHGDKKRIADMAGLTVQDVNRFYKKEGMSVERYTKVLEAHLVVMREKKTEKEKLNALEQEAVKIQEELKN